MKLKTSRRPEDDPARLTAVRKEVGDSVQLFADANGALTRKSPLYWADRFARDGGVCWPAPCAALTQPGRKFALDH
jgi:L-alanine-DL-glutamate epimerase-like enolase superfamily enzyme